MEYPITSTCQDSCKSRDTCTTLSGEKQGAQWGGFLSVFQAEIHDSWVVCWNLGDYIYIYVLISKHEGIAVPIPQRGWSWVLDKKTPQISIWWNFKHRSTVLACIHHTHTYKNSIIQIHTAITADKYVSYVTYIDIASSVVLYNQGNRTPLNPNFNLVTWCQMDLY